MNEYHYIQLSASTNARMLGYSFDSLLYLKKKVMIGPANNTGDHSHDEAAWKSCFDHGWPRAGGSLVAYTGCQPG